MNHDSRDRRFYTYIHRDTQGRVVYVGSGSGRRYKRSVGRTLEHRSIFDTLSKEIVEDSLTKAESVEKEQLLYDQFSSTGILLNTRRPTKTLEIQHETLLKYFKYDENSPTYLTRIKDICCGKNLHPKYKSGDPAGSVNRLTGYGIVSVEKKRYSLHRVVWSLFHKVNVPENLVIDHIDNNPRNNTITNLRLSTFSQNAKNRKDFDDCTNLKLLSNGAWSVRFIVDGITRCKTFNSKVLFPSKNVGESVKDAKILAQKYIQAFTANQNHLIEEIENFLEKQSQKFSQRGGSTGYANIYYEPGVNRYRVITTIFGKKSSKSFAIRGSDTKECVLKKAIEYRDSLYDK